jgi:hypothetical protein
MSEETSYWLVCDLTYQQAVNLAASDLVKNFQRNAHTGETRFWPNSKGVYNYLSEHAPEKVLILKRGTRELKTFPVRRPVKMGANIPD